MIYIISLTVVDVYCTQFISHCVLRWMSTDKELSIALNEFLLFLFLQIVRPMFNKTFHYSIQSFVKRKLFRGIEENRVISHEIKTKSCIFDNFASILNNTTVFFFSNKPFHLLMVFGCVRFLKKRIRYPFYWHFFQSFSTFMSTITFFGWFVNRILASLFE